MSPMVVIRNHSIISNDLDVAPKYLSTQEQAISYFEDTLMLLGTESQQACQRRWNALPHSLQIREYHSSESLRNALERFPYTKESCKD